MSVVGLTFGSAANAIRPSAANAASVADQRDDPRVRPACARTRRSRAISATARIAKEPSCQLMRRASCASVGRSSATPSSGVSAPPAPPRIRAVSVAKYVPPQSTSATRAVGDRRAVGEQHDPLGERGDELGVVGRDEHGGVETAEQGGEVVLAAAVHARGSARRGTRPRAARPPVTEHDRERQPLLLAAGQVARMAIAAKPSGSRPTRSSAAAGASCGDRLVDQVVGRVLEQQRDPPGALRRARGWACISPAAWRSSVDLPAPLRPISATRSPGASVSESAAQDRGPVAQLVPDAVQSQRRRRLRRGDRGRAGGSPRSSGSSSRSPGLAQRRASALDPRAPVPARARRAAARRGSRAPAPCGAPRRGTPAGVASHTTRPPVSAITRSAAARQRSSRCSASTIVDVAVLVQPAQQADQLVAGDRVELRGRLVEHDQLRPPGERRAERDALQLAAGQLGGRAVEQMRDPERERRLLDAARDARPRDSPRFSSGNASSARTVPITTCVSGSWNSVPTDARELARAVLAGVHARDQRAAGERPAVEVRHEPASRRAAASTCPSPTRRRGRPARPGAISSETSSSAGRCAPGSV